MKIGIMQSYFFPYIGYFQLIDSVNTFIIYENVTFRKKSWITRNRILDKGKEAPFYINLPVKGKSSNKLIKELEINEDGKWKKKLLNLIYFNYKKAPCFNKIYPFLEEIIYYSETNLHSYNSNIIIKLCELLNFETKIVSNNFINEDIELELKEQKDINFENVKSERIIKLTKKYNCTTYVNPIGGTELYDKVYFKKKGLELFFVQSQKHLYKQFGDSFTPGLSIIDVLMHNGVDKTIDLIKEYKLV